MSPKYKAKTQEIINNSDNKIKKKPPNINYYFVTRTVTPNQIPIALLDKVEDKINEMLEAGILTKVESAKHTHPAFLAKKPNGDLQILINAVYLIQILSRPDSPTHGSIVSENDCTPLNTTSNTNYEQRSLETPKPASFHSLETSQENETPNNLQPILQKPSPEQVTGDPDNDNPFNEPHDLAVYDRVDLKVTIADVKHFNPCDMEV